MYNPLGGRAGGSATINSHGLLTAVLQVREVRAAAHPNGAPAFTDYVLAAASPDPSLRARLRAVPGPTGPNLLLMRPFDRFPLNEDFLGVLTDTTGRLEVTENGIVDAYQRPEGVSEARAVQVEVESTGGTEMRDLECWDYARQAVGEGGQSEMQYLFVELDRQDGYFELWHGTPIAAARVFLT